MKKFAIVSLSLLLVCLVGQAQQKYSLESLEKLSQEELENYHNKSVKLQKAGKTVNIVGGAILGTGVLTAGTLAMFEDADMGVGAALICLGIPGLSILMVGIPMNITGKKRVEKINTIKNTVFRDVNIDLKPSIQYNIATQNYQPAIALIIRF